MKIKTNELVKAAFFLALGLILPYIFHMIGGTAGQILLPMHIPVLLCGFILGERYGLIVGIITPILNSVLTGMPPFFPTAAAMMLELGIYGFVSGHLYKNKKINIFVSLITAMLLGRLISGTANFLLLSMASKSYMFTVFITSSFVTPIWGIIIQIVLIPVIVKAADGYMGKAA